MENGAPPITSYTPPTHRVAGPASKSTPPFGGTTQKDSKILSTVQPGTYDAAKRALSAASEAAIAYGDQAEATRRRDTISAALGRPAATAPFPMAGPAHTENQQRYGSLSGLPAPQSQVQEFPANDPKNTTGTKNAISKASQQLALRLASQEDDDSAGGQLGGINSQPNDDGVYPLSN